MTDFYGFDDSYEDLVATGSIIHQDSSLHNRFSDHIDQFGARIRAPTHLKTRVREILARWIRTKDTHRIECVGMTVGVAYLIAARELNQSVFLTEIADYCDSKYESRKTHYSRLLKLTMKTLKKKCIAWSEIFSVEASLRRILGTVYKEDLLTHEQEFEEILSYAIGLMELTLNHSQQLKPIPEKFQKNHYHKIEGFFGAVAFLALKRAQYKHFVRKEIEDIVKLSKWTLQDAEKEIVKWMQMNAFEPPEKWKPYHPKRRKRIESEKTSEIQLFSSKAEVDLEELLGIEQSDFRDKVKPVTSLRVEEPRKSSLLPVTNDVLETADDIRKMLDIF
jgi:hypothetical protein